MSLLRYLKSSLIPFLCRICVVVTKNLINFACGIIQSDADSHTLVGRIAAVWSLSADIRLIRKHLTVVPKRIIRELRGDGLPRCGLARRPPVPESGRYAGRLFQPGRGAAESV